MYEEAAGRPDDARPADDRRRRAAFLADALAGLSAPRKSLPGKYIWDEAGSTTFDRICESRDYYPTRRETAVLRATAPEVARIAGPGVALVEYGSGASIKSRIVLDALDRPARYVPIDIADEHLAAAAAAIARDYPGLAVLPVHADYSRPISLPPAAREGGAPILGFFPGSTIGNFSPDAATAFLERARDTLGRGLFLVGVDANRDAATLAGAYNGDLMAALHGNLLARLAAELGADLDASAFRHEARVVQGDPSHVEAHLVALRPTSIRLDGRTIRFAAGESIHTDRSYKYPPDAFRALATRAGWEPVRHWPDADGMLGLHLLRA